MDRVNDPFTDINSSSFDGLLSHSPIKTLPTGELKMARLPLNSLSAMMKKEKSLGQGDMTPKTVS
jgi:hypothetical protein